MGRVKEQMMIEQEREFEHELSYQEYLEEESDEPYATYMMKMAKALLSGETYYELFWSVYSANNVGYYPLIIE